MDIANCKKYKNTSTNINYLIKTGPLRRMQDAFQHLNFFDGSYCKMQYGK